MTTAKFDREQPQRYVRYGRMSTECENPRSIDQQFDSIKLSRQMRDGVEWTHVGDFRDEGLSGRNPLKRPALRQLMEEIRSGQLRIDAILVDSVERLARTEELQAIRDELNKCGVIIVSSDIRRS